MFRRFTFALALASSLTACGDDDHHHDEAGCGLEANCTDTVAFAEGITVLGDDGKLSVKLVHAEPAPPAAKAEGDAGDALLDNQWTVQVVDESGAVIEGAEVTSVRTWSIDCMHYGAEIDDNDIAITHDAAEGTFTWTHQYLHGGPWSVMVHVSGNGESDVVQLKFCLEETGAHHH